MITRGLKPLRHPRAWLALWWAAVLLVFIVCLVPAPELPTVPRGFDKIQHFLAFFLLAASAVQLYATRRSLCCAALGLLALGIRTDARLVGQARVRPCRSRWLP